MSTMKSAQVAEAHRLKLVSRIGRKFETITEDVRVGGLELRFTRIADPNRVLDQVAAAEDLKDKLAGHRREGNELYLPYWAELWDSAFGVSEFMAMRETGVRVWGEGFRVQGSGFSGEEEKRAEDQGLDAGGLPLQSEPLAVRRPSVLDLGCGMGLTGTVAAGLGANVLFADLSPDALMFARANSTRFEERVRTRRLNWRKDRLDEQFDVIIGADILYERVQWEYLEPFWRHHLAEGGRLLLGEPGRATGGLFLEWIKSHPWAVDEYAHPVPTRSQPIRIFLLKKRG